MTYREWIVKFLEAAIDCEMSKRLMSPREIAFARRFVAEPTEKGYARAEELAERVHQGLCRAYPKIFG